MIAKTDIKTNLQKQETQKKIITTIPTNLQKQEKQKKKREHQ